MTTRAAVTITMMAFAPISLAAQSTPTAGPSTALTRSGVATAQSAHRGAEPLCDGSEVRSAHTRTVVGRGLMVASLPVALIGMHQTVHSADHPRGPVSIGIGAGMGLAILGYAVAASGQPNESFWESALQRMRPGDTSTEDVRECFARPVAQATTDTTEEWTYLVSRGITGLGRVRAVRLTFRDNLLIGIRRTEVDAALFHDRRDGLLPTSVLTDPQ